MTRVVDASVALRWFVEAPGSAAAAQLLSGRERLIAPDLIVAEVANAAWKLARAGEITSDHGARIASTIGSAFADLVPSTRLVAKAFDLAAELGHPVYDCLYLVLAEAEGARLVTADARLRTRVAKTTWGKLVDALPTQ